MEYYIIIASSIIIILSYLFNWFSAKTNFPSVLLLIMLGILIQQLTRLMGLDQSEFLILFGKIRLLELLGTLGLIMIVLEAALDLKLEKEKLGLISKAFISALVILLATAFVCSYLIMSFIPQMQFVQAMIYATPLSILSSAIVLPSVTNLADKEREFHIYESTLSDILGIMMFYFLLSLTETSSEALAVGDFTLKLILTIGISIVLSFILIYLFQKLEAKVKMFLMTAVLILLYSVGKLMHLSSLIIILIFGLILNNHRIFFSGKFRNIIHRETTDKIYETFHLITMESAFVIRTFFFVLFGFMITLSSLISLKVAILSGLILVAIYALRGLLLKLIIKKNIVLATSIAPRGLITLLLFYSIPEDQQSFAFSEGILLYVIIISSILMTLGLIRDQAKRAKKEIPTTDTYDDSNAKLPEKERSVRKLDPLSEGT